MHVIEELDTHKLAYSIGGFSQATEIGVSTIYADARSGKLKTYLLGEGKRKKRIILREDGEAYLRALQSGQPDEHGEVA